MQHLRVLLQRLQAAGLVINQENCVLGVEEVELLGPHVSATGVVPTASRVAAILELQGFLGVINFYRRFGLAVSRILKSLTDQLKGNPKPSAAVCWTAETNLWRPRRLWLEVSGSSTLLLEQRSLC